MPERRPATFDSGRVLRFEVPIESDADVAALEGALLAARAAELAQMRRRGDRQAFGYGSDSARETMSDEVDQAQRRWTMLDRQLAALKAVNPRG
jgi:alpha-D-ribose 1-methylphosphonate 5-triphosphate synthase subunit PhnI